MQKGKHYRHLLCNVIIEGVIECETGLHIGGSSDTLEIGGIDKPVIRHPITNQPYMPGSSLKGKLRSITEKIVTKDNQPLLANRHGGDKEKKVWRHECDDYPNAVRCPLCRVYGATGKKAINNNWPGSLLVRDGLLNNFDEMSEEGIPIFETKMENSLDRLTSAAHPRQVERVPAGAKFTFGMVYRLDAVGEAVKGETTLADLSNKFIPNLKEDFTNLLSAMEILEYDGIGGMISRGSGQIELNLTTFKALNRKGAEIASIAKEKVSEVKGDLNSFIESIKTKLSRQEVS